MSEKLLTLRVTEHAELQLASLRADERRILDAWFDHLRNWHNDEFIRSKSKRLDSDEELQVFQTSSDLVIAFQIKGSEVVIRSIFHADALKGFEQAAPR